AKLAARPCTKSSIHRRALAIAIKSASRRPAFIGGLWTGTWMMPLTAAGAGVGPGAGLVGAPPVRRPPWGVFGAWAWGGPPGLRGLDDLAQPKLEMVRGQCHTLEMTLEEVAIIAGQLLPGAARAQMAAQRRQDERLDLGGGNAADQSGRLRLLLQHSLGDVIA